MSQVIAIVNQKGGVAKTTTTVNFAAGLVQQGEKVLCIDLDPQANLTMSLGCQTPDELSYTIADVIDKAIAEQPIDPSEGVIHHAEGIDLIRSTYGGSVKVFDSEIPMSVRAVECGAEGKSIFKHDPKGKVAEAYANLALEVIENAEREQRRAHQHQTVR